MINTCWLILKKIKDIIVYTLAYSKAYSETKVSEKNIFLFKI